MLPLLEAAKRLLRDGLAESGAAVGGVGGGGVAKHGACNVRELFDKIHCEMVPPLNPPFLLFIVIVALQMHPMIVPPSCVRAQPRRAARDQI